jgi:hypothetical protein
MIFVQVPSYLCISGSDRQLRGLPGHRELDGVHRDGEEEGKSQEAVQQPEFRGRQAPAHDQLEEIAQHLAGQHRCGQRPGLP